MGYLPCWLSLTLIIRYAHLLLLLAHWVTYSLLLLFGQLRSDQRMPKKAKERMKPVNEFSRFILHWLVKKSHSQVRRRGTHLRRNFFLRKQHTQSMSESVGLPLHTLSISVCVLDGCLHFDSLTLLTDWWRARDERFPFVLTGAHRHGNIESSSSFRTTQSLI